MNYLRDYKIPKKLIPIAEEVYNYYLEYMLEAVPAALTESNKLLMQRASYCFVLNAAFFCNRSNRVIPVVYGRSYYSQDLIYNARRINRKISWRYTLQLFEALEYHSLATFEKGCVEEWEYDWVTRKVKPSVKTNSRCTLGKILFESILAVNESSDIKVLTDVMKVRDKGKKLIQKKLGQQEKQLMNMIKEWNEFLCEQDVTLDDERYEVQGYKVFNDSSFDKGGRTYLTGLGENMRMLKCARRNRIKVNGEPTIEIDYKALHPRIIAEQEGDILAEDFDPYGIELEGYNQEGLRNLSKVAFMCLLGSKNKRGAQMALNKHIADDKKTGEDSEINIMQEQGDLPNPIDSGTIVDLVYERNTYAAGWFGEGLALTLQNIDSKIMDYCISYMTQNDKFILPIHDSIIIMKSDLELGKKLMEDAYEEILGSKHNCKLKVIDYYGEDNE